VITANGGTADYNVSWTGTTTGNPAGTEIAVSGGTYNMTGLVAGTYNITVTDANNCTATTSVTITEPTVLDLSVASFSNETCSNLDNGSITVSAVGGTATIGSPYTYSITSPIVVATQVSPTFNSLTGSIGGITYTVQVTDANGCTDNITQIITEPTALDIAVTGFTNETCSYSNNASINVSASGSFPGYSYQIITPIISASNNSGSFTGLTGAIGAGTSYTIEVTDANGCINQVTQSVTEPNILDITVNSFNNETCNYSDDASIEVTGSGGTPSYVYQIILPTLLPSNNTGIFNGLTGTAVSGTIYTIRVTDANGCFDIVNQTLTEPPLLDISVVSAENESCSYSNNGSIIVAAVGGTNTAANPYNYTITAPVVIGPQTSAVFNNLSGTTTGTTYNIQVTDANGCTDNTNQIITEPALLTSSISVTTNYFGEDVSCEGETDGAAIVNALGGTPGYSYEWNTSPIQTTQQANNLGTGTYSVTVTDANDCESVSLITLTANPLPQITLPPAVGDCEYNSVTIQSPVEPGGSCIWEFSDGQIFNDFGPFDINFAAQGCYDLNYTLTNLFGCTSTQIYDDYICMEPAPIAAFTSDPNEINVVNNLVNFDNLSQGASTYIWDFGDNSSFSYEIDPSHEFFSNDEFNSSTFTVTLYAFSQNNCVDTAIGYISYDPYFVYYVPNAFTPDGDDNNNYFKPVFGSGFAYENYSFMIFNRWGELIFETNDIGGAWDGTYRGENCQDGVYTWKLVIQRSNNAEKFIDVGHVTLIR
jgi:gliding motility-associated-like protein